SHKSLTNGHRVGAPPLNRPPKFFFRSNVLPNVVTPAKFGLNRLTRFCSTGGPNRLFPILSRAVHTTVLCTIVQHCDIRKNFSSSGHNAQPQWNAFCEKLPNY